MTTLPLSAHPSLSYGKLRRSLTTVHTRWGHHGVALCGLELADWTIGPAPGDRLCESCRNSMRAAGLLARSAGETP